MARLLLSMLSLSLVVACGADRPEDLPSIKLVDGLASKQSSEAIRSSDAFEGREWKVVIVNRFTPPGSDREVVEHSVEVSGYEIGQHPGRLFLDFYDDLLAQVEFCPTKLDEFLAWLDREKGLKLREHSPGTRQNGRIVLLTLVYPDLKCVVWRDQKLMDMYPLS